MAAFVDRVSERIGMLHVKDVDRIVIEEGRSAAWDYAGFVRHPVWREPGTGDLERAKLLKPWVATDVWCVNKVDLAAAATAEDSMAICGSFIDALR